jgi:hypothetical protein
MAERTLSDQEMVDILEEIARDGGNAAARIAAIKTLKELADGDDCSVGGFDALDELSPRRNRSQAA